MPDQAPIECKACREGKGNRFICPQCHQLACMHGIRTGNDVILHQCAGCGAVWTPDQSPLNKNKGNQVHASA